MNTRHEWLAVHHGNAPLIVSLPHTGTEIPPDIESQLVSPWLARKDTDYWVDVLFAPGPASLRRLRHPNVIDGRDQRQSATRQGDRCAARG